MKVTLSNGSNCFLFMPFILLIFICKLCMMGLACIMGKVILCEKKYNYENEWKIVVKLSDFGEFLLNIDKQW